MKKLSSILAARPEEIYFNSFTDAVNYARKMAEKKGFEISDDDWVKYIGYSEGRPAEGKTTRIRVPVTKNGKPVKKELYIQVYGGNTQYELNYYVQ